VSFAAALLFRVLPFAFPLSVPNSWVTLAAGAACPDALTGALQRLVDLGQRVAEQVLMSVMRNSRNAVR